MPGNYTLFRRLDDLFSGLERLGCIAAPRLLGSRLLLLFSIFSCGREVLVTEIERFAHGNLVARVIIRCASCNMLKALVVPFSASL